LQRVATTPRTDWRPVDLHQVDRVARIAAVSDTFEADVDAIIAEIVSLRSPADALIRAMDAHTYWPVAESKQKGAFGGLNGYW